MYKRQDISLWNVSSITNLTGMFDGATSFNQDLSSWDVSNVTSMGGVFSGASSFNGDISSWNVSSVTIMEGLFHNAFDFNQDLSGWDVSNVTNMEEMFDGTQSLSNYNKCAINASFSLNDNWPYDWSDHCIFTPFSKEELQTAIEIRDNRMMGSSFHYINARGMN